MRLIERLGLSGSIGNSHGSAIEANFIATEILKRADVRERREKLAVLVSSQIVPALVSLHRDIETPTPIADVHPDPSDIAELAHLVLGPDADAAAAYVALLRDRGLAMDTLFVELLEPSARFLGEMWDRDECDFIDVTLGVARLQKLLAIFNTTHEIHAFNEKRTVLMAMTPGDQHFFGGQMVEKFLTAGGWEVQTETEANAAGLGRLAESRWFAVAGLTLGSEARLDNLAPAIAAIRASSRNPGIGIMVGGPLFNARPELVAEVGADGTAINAPAAVLMTQRLFDIGALSGWSAREGTELN